MSVRWRDMLRWVGEQDLVVFVALLLAVGGVWGFIELTDEVREGTTQRFDEWAIRYLDTHRGPPWMEEVGRDLTALGGVAVLGLVTAMVAGYLMIRRQYGALGLLILVTVGALLLAVVLKSVIDRNRPNIAPHRSMVYTQSFPSGHSMLSASIYLTLGTMLARLERRKRLKLYFLGVALLLTFLVGVSRVYMSVHWPTDVLAGWAAGLVWAILLWLVTRWLQRRGTVEQEKD